MENQRKLGSQPDPFSRLRQQMWWAISVAFGVGILSLILSAGALYCSSRGSRSWSQSVNQAADAEAARWQALSALQSSHAAQLAAIRLELMRLNEVVAALTNRPPVTTWTMPVTTPADVSHDAEMRGLLAPLLFQKDTDEDWRLDYERNIRICPNGANEEYAPMRLSIFKTNVVPYSVLPKVGSDHWSLGLIIAPKGPDGVNKQGVQSSSYLIGVKGTLP